MCLFENRVHGTSSRYKLATTNHNAEGFPIGKLATASFPSNISMCVNMLEGKLAFVQNRAHGKSSRYKIAATNLHGQGFSIGKLATESMCVMLEGKLAVILWLFQNRALLSLAIFLGLFPCVFPSTKNFF